MIFQAIRPLGLNKGRRGFRHRPRYITFFRFKDNGWARHLSYSWFKSYGLPKSRTSFTGSDTVMPGTSFKGAKRIWS